MYIHNISLSFDNLDVISTGIKIKQHDSKFHKLVISGIDFSDGDRAIIKFLRPDGVVVCDEFAYNDSDEYIICSAALAESGTVSAEISVYNGDARITSHTFTFEVVPDINTDYIFTENDTIPLVHSLLNEMRNHVTKEDGKGLSTNDYDNEAKAAVDGLNENLSKKEDVNNKVSEISSSSTDTQYPTAKAMYEKLKHIEVGENWVHLGDVGNVLGAARGIMIGLLSDAGQGGIGIGTGAWGLGSSIAIGKLSVAAKLNENGEVSPETPSSFSAIQLGAGRNLNDHTFQIYDYQVTGYDGTEDADKYYLKDVGKLSDLTTTEKGSIVGAVNELDKNKVSFENYPFETEDAECVAGVVKVENHNKEKHGIEVTDDGVLRLFPATENDIAKRTNVTAPITPAHLDYAVRSVKPEVLGVLKGMVDTIGGGSSIDFDVREMALHCNTIMSLKDTYKSLTFNLPSGKYGDWIQVDFCSGTTPPALTISSSHGITDHDFTPEPNTMYSLYFDWGLMRADGLSRDGWRFSYAEYPYSEV